MTTPDGFFEEFLDDYFAECDEHLATAARTLLAMEAASDHGAPARADIEELFRIFHSLKGISAMVELRPAEELAHSVEHYLRALRDRELTLTTEGVDALIQATQRLEQIIGAKRFDRPMPAFDDVLARLTGLTGATGPEGERGQLQKHQETSSGTASAAVPPGEPDGRRWLGTFTPTRELLAQGIGVDAIRTRLNGAGTIVEAVPHVGEGGTIAFRFTVVTAAGVDLREVLRDAPLTIEEIDLPAPSPAIAAVPPRLDEAGAAGVAPSHVVRVDLTRLDELMKNVGDLVITRARLADTVSRIERETPTAGWRAVQEHVLVIDRQLRTLREGIMRVRLVPIGEIFRRMPFVVRDLARDHGKQVLVDLQGQSTEIDKFLIERMMDPVLHLVRNAISHGIETPDVRIARGKRPEGTISLRASTIGEMVTVEVADDGQGVDVAGVVARARAVGLPVPTDTPDASALLALLCAPGFSIRDESDRGSGRGVGMAVVKDAVEQLSGTMTLDTQPGLGTRFSIQLPLTLAIADALIGRVGAETFAVPQSAVREVIEVRSADVRMVEQNEIIPYRGAALPIVRLARLFGIDDVRGDRFHAFVVGHGAAAIGLGVDRILGQREIVVRAIADPLVRVDGISGATDLGDGRVVLILDPAALSRLTRDRRARVVGDLSTWGQLRA